MNPYPYLVAWQRGTDIPLAFRQAAASPSPAPAVGAVLVDGTPELDAPPAPDGGLAVPVSYGTQPGTAAPISASTSRGVLAQPRRGPRRARRRAREPHRAGR